MENNIRSNQRPMSWLAFTFMRSIMSVRRIFRNIEKELSLADIEAGDSVLDYGCGLGYNTIKASEIVGVHGRVLLLDISPFAIRTVKRKVRKNRIMNIEFVLSDHLSDTANEIFDIVLLHNTLPMVKDKERTINEIARLLKYGGRLSYVSRAGSRICGQDNMNNNRLTSILEKEHGFYLYKEVKGHLIFIKEPFQKIESDINQI